MAGSYLGDVRAMGFTAVPAGWAPCKGQLLPIAGNDALFGLLGTAFGGDGHTNFALPSLAGIPAGGGAFLNYCLCVQSAPAYVILGEVRAMPFGFAPSGWLPCQGQLLATASNTGLFSLLLTTYGGDGESTFALPDARGRFPVHRGQGSGLSNYSLGQTGGQETLTLTTQQMPVHAHSVYGSNAKATKQMPGNNHPAYFTEQNGTAFDPTSVRPYRPITGTTPMAVGMIGTSGGGQPHDNVPPFNTLTCIISLFGIFPTQN